jgi:hypothetical protein
MRDYSQPESFYAGLWFKGVGLEIKGRGFYIKGSQLRALKRS